jgi:hypothetical protein
MRQYRQKYPPNLFGLPIGTSISIVAEIRLGQYDHGLGPALPCQGQITFDTTQAEILVE